MQTLLADINIFYIGEDLSSIILIALCLQNCAQKKMRKLGDLTSTLEIAQVSCFSWNCYRGFNTLWSTLLSCFGIRMLQSYWNIAKFLEVFGQGNFLTERFVAIRCVNVICTDKNGSGKSYLLDLPVCEYWSAIIVHNTEVAVEFSELPSIQNYPNLPYDHALMSNWWQPVLNKLHCQRARWWYTNVLNTCTMVNVFLPSLDS